MAERNFQHQPNNSHYFYYNQQYPPQFYYQQDPQYYYYQEYDPQNYYYQGGGNQNTQYFQGGENQNIQHYQGGDNQNTQHYQGADNQSGQHNQEQENSKRSGGSKQNTRGRGQRSFHSTNNNRKSGQKDEKVMQKRETEYESEMNNSTNDRKENIPQNYDMRHHSNNYENNYSSGRDQREYDKTTGRQFQSNNSAGFDASSSHRRGSGNYRQTPRRGSGRNDRNYEYDNVNRNEPSRGNDFRQGSRNNFRGNNQRNYHERKDERHFSANDSNSREENTKKDSGRNQTRNVNKDKNVRQYGRGEKGSPRQVEMDSRTSFEKRNNPKQSDDAVSIQDEKKSYDNKDKKYKMPTSDRRYTNKHVMKILAGKVDETQRGLLIEQLTLGTYECMVCCETVKCHHAVWNCPGCFHVFHLRCIRKWARSPTALVEGEGTGWRCPACQKVTEQVPNQYRCFCNKLRDPEWDRMETPHSCGNVCSKNRGDNCSHPCNILCHPGPCPPCSAVVNRSCACGKESKSVKCSVTEEIKCETVCGKVLNCGKHFCKATCHGGSCNPCEEIMTKECYGSHEKKEVICGSSESFTKSYNCDKPCDKTLLCGNHNCDVKCHAGDCEICQTLPEEVTHCPCGATPLKELSDIERTSCTDPIPPCDKICNKSLGCGPPDKQHRCQKTCHEGPCGPCDGMTSLTCRCGARDKDIPCTEVHQYTDDNPYTCDRRCNKKRTCGRHKCGQLCCVSEEHTCNQLCNRKLNCGEHKCDEPCHRGNCPPCLMSGYDELSCHCGAEVMMPPIPCGTKPPECRNPCLRLHSCDHTVYHQCHSDTECPPCTVLTEKWCMGKHELRKNIPCHLTNVSCGLPCNKVLPCQQHKCTKTCHAGDCQGENEKCSQPCRIKRKDCNHICGAPCHHGSTCPQTPCKAEVLLMCKCGNKEAKVPCMAGVAQDTAEYQKLTMQSLAGSLQSGQTVDISQLGKKKLKRQLDCDSECAVLERNRRMALALEIRNPDLGAKLGNPTFTDFLKDYAKQNPHFIASVEKALSELVKNAKQSKHPHRSHAFSPGNCDQRRALHELAECYGCETQSYDYEPKKNVVATAYRDKCWLPSVTLTSYIQRELHPKAPMPIPHVHSEEVLRQTAQAAKQSTDVLSDIKPPSRWDFPKTEKKKSNQPEIDYFDFSTS